MTDYSASDDAPIRFESEQLFDAIERCSAPSFDLLEFGVIGFDRTGVVRRYNAMESRLGGLAASTVVGHHLFDVVAPCMNNFMVAERFTDALSERRALDIVIDYVLTLRMRPQRVKLRLLAQPDADMRYVLVQRNL
jgi:photoactive yellow protein